MKSRLPKLSMGLALVLALLPHRQLCPSPAAVETRSAGDDMIRQAADNLAQLPSLEAKLRQRVALFDQYLVGSGSYRQLIIGDRKLLRLELKLQVADQTTSLLQVSDGTRLWEKRHMDDTPRLAYVNLRRVRAALQDASTAGAKPADWLAIGGLDSLLRGLKDAFHFESAVPEILGDLPVWALRGHWRVDRLKAWTSTGQGGPTPSAAQLAALPEHMPHSVVVILGRDSFPLLFPYRLEFRRYLDPASAGTSLDPKSERALVTVELFDVNDYEVDPRHFEFHLHDQQIEDRTEAFLERQRHAPRTVR